jgi:cytochrome P450
MVLTHVMFHLAHNKQLVRELQEQLDALPSLGNEHLQTLPLLDAIINETMRLNPPVPGGLQRMTPPEGLQIGERYIPGDVIVQVPAYTVCRGNQNSLLVLGSD